MGAQEPSGGNARVRKSTPHQPVVVVGIDGSEGSSKALAWAAEEARMRGAVLRVVHAWRSPALSSVWYLRSGSPAQAEGRSAWGEKVYENYRDEVMNLSDGEPRDAEDLVGSQIADVLGQSPQLQLERYVTEGRAAQAILEAAKGADLVVVGSRGLGGFVGLLLGSVSSQVVHHARCPVTVVHG